MGKSLVFEVRDKRVIPEIMEMIKKTDATGVNVEEVGKFIFDNLGREDTKLFVSFDGEQINGFILSYVVYTYIHPEVFIAWAYIDPKEKTVGRYLLGEVESWAKKLGIKKVSAIVRDNLAAFEKKYGFKLEYYSVSKEV